MKTVLLLTITAFATLYATCATASGGETERLDKWANKVIAIKKGECANDLKKVRKLLDYAAILIAHNETGEASEVLGNALRRAKSDICKTAIKKKANRNDS